MNTGQFADRQTENANAVQSTTSPDKLCSVLVPSCDAYSDLWKPFWTLFWRFWPDCPFPVFLGSNHESYDDPKVRAIHASGGVNWTNRVREQILALDTPYVLMILEDFFFQSPVNSRDVLTCLSLIRELDGLMLRLTPRPAPNTPLERYPMIGSCSSGAPYRVSTQTAIWRRDALLNLMRDGESIWQFEKLGSRRSDVISEGYYSTWKPVMTYGHHVVERGKWFSNEAHKFDLMNIGCDFSRRPIMSPMQMFRYNCHKHSANLMRPLYRWWSVRRCRQVIS